MRLSRHVCGYIGREVGVLRYELYGLVTLLYRVQVDSHVRKPWTVLLTQGTIYRYAPDAPAATGVSASPSYYVYPQSSV